MKIGIDIDDTICEGPDDDVPEALSEEWHERIKNAYALPGSIEAIRKLIDRNHQIYFISSRYLNDRYFTTKWFKTFYINPNEYTLCLRPMDMYGPQFKRTLIASLGLDVYIDDKPRLVAIAQEYVNKAILFTDWNDVINEIENIKLL